LHVANPLLRVNTAEAGLANLGSTGEELLPGLILLDLNLPGMGGLEFLKTVKADGRLRRIPVVVLTTSALESDRLSSFDQSVAGYMVKPVDYTQFIEIIRGIRLYWTLSETP
jgi:CheY-like chemotaxis protein